MRGSPLFRALVAFAVLTLLGWPLWRLTQPKITAVIPADEVAIPRKRTQLRFAFTQFPRAIEVRHLGRTLWAATAPEPMTEAILNLPWPQEGVDLEFHIDWPADAPLAAARVRLVDPDGNEHEKSIWSQGPVAEVLTFP